LKPVWLIIVFFENLRGRYVSVVANQTPYALSSYTLHSIINYFFPSVKIGPCDAYRLLLIKIVNVVNSVFCAFHQRCAILWYNGTFILSECGLWAVLTPSLDEIQLTAFTGYFKFNRNSFQYFEK
jgi:hypothetical protein